MRPPVSRISSADQRICSDGHSVAREGLAGPKADQQQRCQVDGAAEKDRGVEMDVNRALAPGPAQRGDHHGQTDREGPLREQQP